MNAYIDEINPWHKRLDWKCPKCNSYDLSPNGDHSASELSCRSCGYHTKILWHVDEKIASDAWNKFLQAMKGQKNSSLLSGFLCKKCRVVNQYALSNQDDGSFVCYSCRN